MLRIFLYLDTCHAVDIKLVLKHSWQFRTVKLLLRQRTNWIQEINLFKFLRLISPQLVPIFRITNWYNLCKNWSVSVSTLVMKNWLGSLSMVLFGLFGLITYKNRDCISIKHFQNLWLPTFRQLSLYLGFHMFLSIDRNSYGIWSSPFYGKHVSVLLREKVSSSTKVASPE